MKEHIENMSKFDENLKKEQDRTKEALRQKLEERRRKRKQSEGQKPEAMSETSDYGQLGTTEKLDGLKKESLQSAVQKPSGSGVIAMPPGLEAGGTRCLKIIHLSMLLIYHFPLLLFGS